MSAKQVAAAFILKRGKLLICQRTKYQSMPLKWEFPGGKIEDSEEPRAALRRELDEELGIDATIGREVTRLHHRYRRGGAVELRFFLVEEYRGEVENRIFKDVRWVARKELPKFDFLEADVRVVRDLAAGRLL
jgi:8-oxo-dGTP diphosphatase